MLLALEVKPIPPSQVVDAVHKAGESAVNLGQGLSEPLAVYALIAAGIMIMVGLFLSFLGITKKLLGAGFMVLVGVAVMFVLTRQPVEVMGILKGLIMGFFGKLGGG